MTADVNPEWITVALAEPWHRDSLLGAIQYMTSEHGPGLNASSLALIDKYGSLGTLEVSACILALRAEIATLRGRIEQAQQIASQAGDDLWNGTTAEDVVCAISEVLEATS